VGSGRITVIRPGIMMIRAGITVIRSPATVIRSAATVIRGAATVAASRETVIRVAVAVISRRVAVIQSLATVSIAGSPRSRRVPRCPGRDHLDPCPVEHVTPRGAASQAGWRRRAGDRGKTGPASELADRVHHLLGVLGL